MQLICVPLPGFISIDIALTVLPLLRRAGDRTSQLMWRLTHGETPQKNYPKVVCVLIGASLQHCVHLVVSCAEETHGLTQHGRTGATA